MSQRRGTTLLEAVIAVVVMAIAVPPTMMLLSDASGSRVEGVSVTRAVFYAQAILEQVIADSASADGAVGLAAMENAADYSAALSERLVHVIGVYQSAGLRHTLTIGPMVNLDGIATGNVTEDVYRSVQIQVIYPAAQAEGTLALQHYITEILP
jgi:hypothetical protein